MMELDEFLEQDIPVFLDGYEDQETNIASETEINSLLTSGESALNSTLANGNSAQVATDQPVTIQTNNITIQTNSGPSTVISHDVSSSDSPAEVDSISIGDQESDQTLSALEQEVEREEAGPEHKAKFNQELVQKGSTVADGDERALYLQALRYLKDEDVRDAISLLYGLLQKHPNYLAYKTRLFDALRLSEDFSDIPLPESVSSSRAATPSSESFSGGEESAVLSSVTSDSTAAMPVETEEDTSSAYASYAKAVELMKQKDYNQAAQLLEELAQTYPDNVAIQVRLEQVRAKKGELYD